MLASLVPLIEVITGSKNTKTTTLMAMSSQVTTGLRRSGFTSWTGSTMPQILAHLQSPHPTG